MTYLGWLHWVSSVLQEKLEMIKKIVIGFKYITKCVMVEIWGLMFRLTHSYSRFYSLDQFCNLVLSLAEVP